MNPKNSGAMPITTIAPISAPRQIDFSDSSKIDFSYIGPQLTIPPNLPTYNVVYSSGFVSSAESLAKQWGFTAPLTKPVPHVYDWIEKEKHFSYNDQAKSVSFAFFTQTPGSSKSLRLTVDDVFRTLSEVSFFSNDFVFVKSGQQVVIPEGGEGGEEESQPLTITSYQSKINNLPYPFYFNGVSRATGEVRTGPDSKIISFSFRLAPSLRKEQERQMLSVDKILENLNDNRGYLQAIITNESAYAPDTTASYSEVQISSITIAYLFISEESRFVPIYVIEGVGRGNKVQRVRYYLRATS